MSTITCCSYYTMPQNAFFPQTRDLLVSQKLCKDTFFHLSSPSPVIFANATVVAFLLLHKSRFNFHCHTQHEPTPNQKSARKWQLRPFVTSCAKDYDGHSFGQTSFTEQPNRTLQCKPLLEFRRTPCEDASQALSTGIEKIKKQCHSSFFILYVT